MPEDELYIINGIQKSFTQWCDEYGQNPLIIRSRISMGSSLEEALSVTNTWHETHYCIDGETHTFQHWCRIFNINESTVKYRLRKGYSLDEALKEPIKRITKTHSNALVFDIDGTEYTITELSVKYGVNQSSIKSRLSRGETIEQALDIDKVERGGKRNKDSIYSDYKLFTINGVTKTLKTWCDELGLPIKTVINRLKSNWPLENIFLPINSAYLYEIHEGDQVHKMTLKQLSEKYKISEHTIYDRLSNGLTLEEAINKEQKIRTNHRKNKSELYIIDGAKLKEIRMSIKPQLPNDEFMEKLNVDGYQFNKRIINNIEKSQRYVSIDELEHFEKILGIPLKDLIVEKVNRKRQSKEIKNRI